jgi:DNA repair protein RecO (recombination protein O)
MPIRTAEAIVLRHYPLAEADRIIVFLTREYGKIRAVAKGIKKTKSKMSGTLEPLNHIRLEYYAREGRDLSYIRQCELVYSYLGKNPSVDCTCAFAYFAELTQEFVQDEQPNELFFRLLIAVLSAGEKGGINALLIRYFELWTLKLGGFLPHFECCCSCGNSIVNTGFYAWLAEGESRCVQCAQNRGSAIKPEAAAVLNRFASLSPAQFAAQSVSECTGEDLRRFSQAMLEMHLEKRLKSYPVLKQLLDHRNK